MRGSIWHAESVPEEEQAYDKPAYKSFLIRCWREEDTLPEQEPASDGTGITAVGEQPAWRFMVVEVGGTQRWRGIVSLDDLMCFLRVHLGP